MARARFLGFSGLAASIVVLVAACGIDDGAAPPVDGSDAQAEGSSNGEGGGSDGGADVTNDVTTDASVDAPSDAPTDGFVEPPQPKPCLAPLAGLVGWWSGDGTYADLSVTPANGASSAAPESDFAFGHVGGAFDFTGSAAGAWVEVPDVAKLDRTGPISIEAWILPKGLANVDGSSMRVVDKMSVGGTDGYALDLFHTGGSYKVRLTLGATTLVSTTAITQLEQWRHVVATWDGTTGRIYVDNAPAGTSTTLTNAPANALTLRIGADHADGSHFDGHVDEVMIHDRAVTVAEISDTFHYGRCKAPTCLSTRGGGPAPVGWWPGDGEYTDRLGGFGGAGTNTAFAEGRVLGAFNLLEPGSFVSVPDDDRLDFTQATPFSIEAWLNMSAAPPAGGGRIVNKVTTGTADGYTLDVLDSGAGPKLRFLVGNDSVAGATTIATNTWIHVAGVWDGTNLRVFVNGVEDGTKASAPTLAANALPLTFGIGSAGGQKLTGRIDEVLLYRSARTASQLLATFNAGASGYCRQTGCLPSPLGLVSWWAGDDDTNDLTGGRHGTAGAGALAYGNGLIARSFDFAGANFVEVPSSAALAPTSFTIEAWVLPTANGGVIFDKYDVGTQTGYRFAMTATGALELRVDAVTVTSAGTVPLGAWSHVAATFSDALSSGHLFVSGADIGDSAIGVSLTPNAGVLRIGADRAAANRFPGRIDEVGFYKTSFLELDPNPIADITRTNFGGRCKQ